MSSLNRQLTTSSARAAGLCFGLRVWVVVLNNYLYRRGGCGACVLATHYFIQWFCMFRRVVRGFLCHLIARLVRMRVFVSNYNISSGLFQTRRFVYKHGLVYKHCVSVYCAFSVLSLLDLLVVFYVYYMILSSCLLVLYVLLVVCSFVPGPTATCSLPILFWVGSLS